jgi:uncharacterized protein with beta-barrel porin domain
MFKKQITVMRGLAFLSSAALVVAATTGRDPLMFGVGLFAMLSNEVGLLSPRVSRKPRLRGCETSERQAA